MFWDQVLFPYSQSIIMKSFLCEFSLDRMIGIFEKSKSQFLFELWRKWHSIRIELEFWLVRVWLVKTPTLGWIFDPDVNHCLVEAAITFFFKCDVVSLRLQNNKKLSSISIEDGSNGINSLNKFPPTSWTKLNRILVGWVLVLVQVIGCYCTTNWIL